MSQKIKNKQLEIISPFDINNNRLINVSNPIYNEDAANKYYVDLIKNELFDITGEPTGFPQNPWLDSNLTLISGDTVSLQPTGTTFFYYIEGQRYDSTGVTLQITDVEGMHYFYFDGEEFKQSLLFTDDLIFEYAYVANVYWDATNKKVIQIGDERHGYIMDPVTHSYLHEVFGTQYVSGLAISTVNAVDGTGDVDGDAQILIEDGRIRDEDILLTITNNNPQQLRPILDIPVYYREGINNWRIQDSTLFPVITGGTGRLAWNSVSANVWGQTEVDQFDFVNYHIFATNDIYNPVISVQGQSEYNNQGAARTGANDEINNLVTSGLPFVEFTPIATIIFQTANGFDNAVKARIRSTDEGDDFVDWRGTKISPGVPPSSHSSLSELDVDSHFQYALLDGRTGDVLKIDTISGFTTGEVSFDNNKITDVLTPTNDTDAANKKYVDDTVDTLTYSADDINLTALSGTSGIYLATNTAVQNVPVTNIRVTVNSIEVNVGNGSTLADCFFSDDGGSTAKTFTNVAQGDNLYWNGDQANYQLETTDQIDFIYLTR